MVARKRRKASDPPRFLTASGAGRLNACPASGAEAEGCVNPSNDKTALGKAWHDVADLWILAGRDVARSSIGEIARKHHADADTLAGWLNGLTWDPPPDTRSEVLLDPVEIGSVRLRRGRVDVLEPPTENRRLGIGDWKTGNPDFADPDKDRLQLAVYGVAAGKLYGVTEADLWVAYVQAGEEGFHLWERVNLAEAERELEPIYRLALRQKRIPKAKRSYRVGEACAFCPAVGKCPAYLRSAGEVIALAEAADVKGREALERFRGQLTPQNAGPMHVLLGQIARRAKDAQKKIEGWAEAQGIPSLPLEEGYELGKVHVQGGYVPAHERRPYSYFRRRKVAPQQETP